MMQSWRSETLRMFERRREAVYVNINAIGVCAILLSLIVESRQCRRALSEYRLGAIDHYN